jgi:RNA ligase
MKELEAKKIFAELLSQDINTKKDDALWIQANCPKVYQGLVFSMLQGRDYSQTVWRMIRPDYQKPFWNR